MAANRRGLMLILSSPSGAGKTTLSRRLIQADPDIHLSVSATTRTPRPGEVDGTDYFFVDHEEFDRMVANDELLEHATVFEHSYGTPAAPVYAALEAGRDVLFDIDWQGTQEIASKASDDLVRVFILPPSIEELRARLQKRAQDPADVVDKRMKGAGSELSHWAEYEYVIINDDFETALSVLQDILHVERLRRRRQPWLAEYVRSLITDAGADAKSESQS